MTKKKTKWGWEYGQNKQKQENDCPNLTERQSAADRKYFVSN